MPRASPQPPSIRGQYERYGSAAYYRQFGSEYRNPHEPIIHESILLAVERWKPDLTGVLDLAAGSGEATLALRQAGAARIDGIDPYTFAAYLSRTGARAERTSFEQIAAGALAGRRYSLIVCSFALHLCEASRLAGLACQLASIAPALLVLTPHKRPEIRPAWGWQLAGEFLLDRVRTRIYRANPTVTAPVSQLGQLELDAPLG